MEELNKVKVTIKISNEGLSSILSSAFMSSSYWLYPSNIKEHKADFHYTLLVPITDDDSEFEKYHLTKNILLSGLKQYIEEFGVTLEENGEIDTCCLDNADCELILQYALFGEQVFG